VAFAEPPPTLAPPTAIPSNPDRREPQTPHSATATPALANRPILRAVQPAPNAEVFGNEIRMSVQVQGINKLVEVTATLNGEPRSLEVMGRDERNWTAFFNEKLAPGEHEVRMVARDERGLSGGARWQFRVVPESERPPSPTPVATAALGPARPKPQPTPTATPQQRTPPSATATSKPTSAPTPRPQASPTRVPPTSAPPAKPTVTRTAAPPTPTVPAKR
jgi:hypothetical protein